MEGKSLVLLRGPNAHSVVWIIADGWIKGTVTCHATEGADCRLICPQQCEAWTITDHKHELIDNGKCSFVEWMENMDDVAECHVGNDHALVDGFITPEFDGDHYVWSYSDA